MTEYYWHSSLSSSLSLSKRLTELEGVRKIEISTAFLSYYGVGLLEKIAKKNAISRENIRIYISNDFSNIKCDEILEHMAKMANVFIVDQKFHAKVYYFQGKRDLLIFGSSNFTQGGIEDNIEFNAITEAFDESKIRAFFRFCEQNSYKVDEDIIRSYRDTEQERRELNELLNQLQKKIHKKLKRKDRSDPFDEYEYDISDYYFTFEDYETLFERNWERTDSIIRQRRKSIQDKLLLLNNNVIKDIQKLGLEHHWIEELITSKIDPNPTNENRVVWVGVRYLKKDTIKYVKEFKLAKDGLGIPKYACIQFALNGDNFAINIFHAVKKGAHDRQYMGNMMPKQDFKQKLIEQIEVLKGKRKKLSWHISEKEFDIDSRNADDFIDFYRENDREGRESFLSYKMQPDDERLKDVDAISKVIVEVARDFFPLYSLISADWKKQVK